MTATAVLEIERKYDVPPTAAVPDLGGLPGVAALALPVEHRLEATYFDTEDLRLRAAGITLRHRTGGDDAGWHLKLPLGGEREELRVPGSPEEGVPAELAGLVRVHTRTRPLVPVARLTTRRTVHRLLGADGDLLAELADDAVTGQALAAGEAELAWREWEVELKTGDRGLLDAVARRIAFAGATPARSSSKVGRVLSTRPTPAGEPPWWVTGQDADPAPTTAGGAVQAHLAEQVADLVARDPQVRRDQPDAVHKMRVATRRLRSALATFRPLLDREQTDPLREELRWLAGVLGGARDAEVMHTRLRGLVAAEPPELVLGPVLARIDTVMSARYRTAHEAVVEALDGERYLTLLDRLDALVAAPPFADEARGRAEEVLPRLVRRQWKRLDRTLAAAEAAERGHAQDALLHESRKQAKRVRYAAEAVTPVFGRPAARLAGAMEDLQEVLGQLQDGVVTREVLRQLGAGASVSGQNGFTFGRLHMREQALAEDAVARFPAARKAASRRKLVRWLEG